jgi:hypothetical protein
VSDAVAPDAMAPDAVVLESEAQETALEVAVGSAVVMASVPGVAAWDVACRGRTGARSPTGANWVEAAD